MMESWKLLYKKFCKEKHSLLKQSFIKPLVYAISTRETIICLKYLFQTSFLKTLTQYQLHGHSTVHIRGRGYFEIVLLCRGCTNPPDPESLPGIIHGLYATVCEHQITSPNLSLWSSQYMTHLFNRVCSPRQRVAHRHVRRPNCCHRQEINPTLFMSRLTTCRHFGSEDLHPHSSLRQTYTNKNKFLVRPLAHSGVKWQYDIVVQRRLGYVSFKKNSFPKMILFTKSSCGQGLLPFHQGFSSKPLFCKTTFWGVHLGTL